MFDEDGALGACHQSARFDAEIDHHQDLEPNEGVMFALVRNSPFSVDGFSPPGVDPAVACAKLEL